MTDAEMEAAANEIVRVATTVMRPLIADLPLDNTLRLSVMGGATVNFVRAYYAACIVEFGTEGAREVLTQLIMAATRADELQPLLEEARLLKSGGGKPH